MDTTFVVARSLGMVDRQRTPAPAAAAAPRPAPCSADLRIGGWLVQPNLNLLSRDGVSMHIRSQLMDLLLCLAGRPGKVFRKEELVDEVWEGRWIAQSALSRCIAELRAALGDDAQHPRVIETITKRGYRLIAPVETVTAPATQPAPVAAVAANDSPEAGAPADPEVAPRTFWQRLMLVARRPDRRAGTPER